MLPHVGTLYEKVQQIWCDVALFTIALALFKASPPAVKMRLRYFGLRSHKEFLQLQHKTILVATSPLSPFF